MKSNKKNFNVPDFARHYIKSRGKILRKLGHNYAKRLKKLNIVEGKILDSGCGSGHMIITLATQLPSCEFIGIDISDPLLEYANHLKIIHNLNDRVQFIKGDVKKIVISR